MQTPGRTGLYIAAANIYIEWVLVLYQINCKNLQENKLVYRMTMPPSKPKTTKMVPLYKMVVSSKNATSIYETSFTMCCRLSPSNPTFLFILLPSSQPFSSVFIRFPSFSHSIHNRMPLQTVRVSCEYHNSILQLYFSSISLMKNQKTS